MLQERSDAQPQIHQRLLPQGTEPSVPASAWVEDLRHELETMPRPKIPDFDPFDLDHDLLELDLDIDEISPFEDLGTLSIQDISQGELIPENVLSIPIGDVPPSTDFQADAAYLQSAAFESPSVAITSIDMVPPFPMAQPACEWYLPPPELGTSLLAEFLTDLNTAVPLYQPDVIVNHLRICYAGVSDGTSVAWTSAYVVFGLAHM